MVTKRTSSASKASSSTSSSIEASEIPEKPSSSKTAATTSTSRSGSSPEREEDISTTSMESVSDDELNQTVNNDIGKSVDETGDRKSEDGDTNNIKDSNATDRSALDETMDKFNKLSKGGVQSNAGEFAKEAESVRTNQERMKDDYKLLVRDQQASVDAERKKREDGDKIMESYERLTIRKGRTGTRPKKAGGGEFAKEAKELQNNQEAMKDEYKRLVRTQDKMEDNKHEDTGYEFPGEEPLYDLDGAEGATVPSAPKIIDPDILYKQKLAAAAPKKEAPDPDVVYKQKLVAAAPQQKEAPPAAEEKDNRPKGRRKARPPSSKAAEDPSSAALLKQRRPARSPPPVETMSSQESSVQASGSGDSYDQLKDDYRRLARPANDTPVDHKSHDQIKEEYRRLGGRKPASQPSHETAAERASQESHDRIKEEYRRLGRNNETPAEKSSRESHDRIKDEYRRLGQPTNRSLVDEDDRRKNSLPLAPGVDTTSRESSPRQQNYDQMKDDYRALNTNPRHGTPTTRSLEASTTESYHQMKDDYRALNTSSDHGRRPQRQSPQALSQSDHAPGRPSRPPRPAPPRPAPAVSPSENPYANYNPYQPGAHDIPTSGSLEARPTLAGANQYSSARTNADSYLVSAHLVKDKSQRFRALEDRQEELENRIAEQMKLLAEHEETLARLRSGGDPSLAPPSLSPVGPSSAISYLSAPSVAIPAPPMTVAEATVIATESELDSKITEREERVRQKEEELDRLMKKAKQKKTGISKLKNLFHRPFRKQNSIPEKEKEEEEPSRRPTTIAFDDSEIDAVSTALSALTRDEMTRSESGPTAAGIADSMDFSLGDDESFTDPRYEEEKREITADGSTDEEEKQEIRAAKPKSQHEERPKKSDKRVHRSLEKDSFDGLSVQDLKALAAEKGVDLSSCNDRIQIVDELTGKGISPRSDRQGESTGEPGLRDEFVSEGKKRSERFIAMESCPFDGYSIGQLKSMAAKAQIDVSSCFDRGEIVTELKNGGVSPNAKAKKRGSDLYDEGSNHDSSGSARGFSLFGKGSDHSRNKDSSDHKREDFAFEGKKRSDRFIAPEKDAFDGYKVSELKTIAAETGVDLTGCVERGQIARKLLDAGVTPKKHGLFGGFKKEVSYDSSKDNQATSPEIVEGKKRAATYAEAPKDVFEGFSISQLKQLARESNTDISNCVERGQICKALKKKGVKPPRKGKTPTSPVPSPARASRPKVTIAPGSPRSTNAYSSKPKSTRFSGYSVGKLKKIARESNVDVSMCVEREEIIQKLEEAGIYN